MIARLAIACMLVAGVARADDSAKQLYDDGLRAYDAGDYARAIESWKKSYAMSKAPLLLFDLGQAYRLSGDCDKAMTYYDDYRRAQPRPDNQDELDQAVGLCSPAEIAKRLYADGLIHYNGKEYPAAIESWKKSYELSKAPLLLFDLGQAYRLSGDCARAMAYYDDYRRAQPQPDNEDELAEAIALCKRAIRPPAPPPPPPPPPPPAREPARRGLRTVGIVVAAAGVAAVAAGGVFAYEGRQLQQDVEAALAADPTWTPELRSKERSGHRDNAMAWASFGAGAAAFVAGGLMFAFSGNGERPVAIAPTRGGATVAWTLRF